MAVSTPASSDTGDKSVKLFNRAAHLHIKNPEIGIHYVEALPGDKKVKKDTILLIHSFSETSYQFRHVVAPLAEAGYHVIAPDKTGQGFSSKPIGDVYQQDPFTKKLLAGDLHRLLTEHIGIKDPIHVVGYDVGGIVAHAFACQFPDSMASVTWVNVHLLGRHCMRRRNTRVSGGISNSRATCQILQLPWYRERKGYI